MKITRIIFIATFLCSALFPIRCAAEEHEADPVFIHSIQEKVHQYLLFGKTTVARNLVEEAITRTHSDELEISLVHILMQAGEYRHALSAAAHTQAEHKDNIQTTILYAWLLAIGGSEKAAMDLLMRYSQEEHARILLEQLQKHQLNPATFSQPLGPVSPLPTATPLQSGVLLDATHVITTKLETKKSYRIKIRNGLGQIVDAAPDKKFIHNNLSLLITKQPLPLSYPLQFSAITRVGVPVYLIGYDRSNVSKAEWPQLKMDVPGIPEVANNYPLHNLNLSDGSGVYNAMGALVGVISRQKQALVMPISQAVEFLHLPTTNTTTGTGNFPRDQIYEAALETSLQVLVDNRE